MLSIPMAAIACLAGGIIISLFVQNQDWHGFFALDPEQWGNAGDEKERIARARLRAVLGSVGFGAALFLARLILLHV